MTVAARILYTKLPLFISTDTDRISMVGIYNLQQMVHCNEALD